MNPVRLSSKLVFGAVLLFGASCAYADLLGLGGPESVTVTNTPGVTVTNTPSVNVANTPNVTVTNMPAVTVNTATPLSVRDTDNPARQPFAAQCAGGYGGATGPSGSRCHFPSAVPAGKVLVIEMVTLGATAQPLPADQITLRVVTNGVAVNHFLNVTSMSETLAVRVYADPDSIVTLFDTGNYLNFTNGSLSGYLVNVP